MPITEKKHLGKNYIEWKKEELVGHLKLKGITLRSNGEPSAGYWPICTGKLNCQNPDFRLNMCKIIATEIPEYDRTVLCL